MADGTEQDSPIASRWRQRVKEVNRADANYRDEESGSDVPRRHRTSKSLGGSTATGRKPRTKYKSLLGGNKKKGDS